MWSVKFKLVQVPHTRSGFNTGSKWWYDIGSLWKWMMHFVLFKGQEHTVSLLRNLLQTIYFKTWVNPVLYYSTCKTLWVWEALDQVPFSMFSFSLLKTHHYHMTCNTLQKYNECETDGASLFCHPENENENCICIWIWIWDISYCYLACNENKMEMAVWICTLTAFSLVCFGKYQPSKGGDGGLFLFLSVAMFGSLAHLSRVSVSFQEPHNYMRTKSQMSCNDSDTDRTTRFTCVSVTVSEYKNKHVDPNTENSLIVCGFLMRENKYWKGYFTFKVMLCDWSSVPLIQEISCHFREMTYILWTKRIEGRHPVQAGHPISRQLLSGCRSGLFLMTSMLSLSLFVFCWIIVKRQRWNINCINQS